MTPHTLQTTLQRLGLSLASLARLTGYAPQTARKWGVGLAPVPAPVVQWLDAEVQHREECPPPTR